MIKDLIKRKISSLFSPIGRIFSSPVRKISSQLSNRVLFWRRERQILSILLISPYRERANSKELFSGLNRLEQWAKDYAIVKGVHTNIEMICKELQIAVKQCNQDSVVVSVVSADEKEILISWSHGSCTHRYSRDSSRNGT